MRIIKTTTSIFSFLYNSEFYKLVCQILELFLRSNCKLAFAFLLRASAIFKQAYIALGLSSVEPKRIQKMAKCHPDNNHFDGGNL